MTTATRHVGFCPICEGDFKLADETKLVHHGYKRPGVGYIIGDCLSVHRLPYELSDEVCHEYKALLLNKLALNENFLVRLERGEVTVFLVERRKPSFDLWRPETEMVEIATPNGYDFSRELESKIHDTKWAIRGLKNEIARMDKWIAAWVLKPVRTLEEELEVKKAAAAVRQAERDAKNAAKQAKKDALAAKQAKWEQEKQALMDKWKGMFIELAAEMVEAEGRDPKVAQNVAYRALEAALTMQKERNKKGYLGFYARELKIDEAMVKLGLAWEKTLPDGQMWISHKF